MNELIDYVIIENKNHSGWFLSKLEITKNNSVFVWEKNRNKCLRWPASINAEMFLLGAKLNSDKFNIVDMQ